MTLRGVAVSNLDPGSNPFHAAYHYTGITQEFVLDRIKDINSIFNANESSLNSIVGKLTDFNFEIPVALFPPQQVVLDFTYEPSAVGIAPPSIIDFGSVTPYGDIEPPPSGGIEPITVPGIPGFNPSYTSLAIPPPPGAIAVPDPGVAPPAPIVLFPPRPPVTLPSDVQLANIVIPIFPGIDMPEFDATFPEFGGAPPNTGLTWSEPGYSAGIIEDSIAQIRVFLAGGSGINPAVENALMDRGRDREDRLVTQQEQQAIEEWATRGYTAPPGLLVQRIDAIRDEGLIKKLGLNRDIVIKVHQDEIENLRFAVQQGIAAEQLYVQLHLAAAQRLFEAQRLAVQWSVDLYNSFVTLFTARMQEVQIRAQVYETQVRAAISNIEVFKAQIDGEIAKGEINKSIVEVYKAQIAAQEFLVRVYESEVRATGVRVQVYGEEVNAYRATVEAYAAKVGAEKVRFDAYEAQVRGELGKASIVESEARAYQAEVQGIGVGVQAQAEAVRAQVAELTANVQVYEAQIREQIARAQVDGQIVDSRVKGFEADTRRYAADIGLEESRSRTRVAAWEAGLRNSIEYYRTQIQQYEVDLRNIVKEVEMALASTTAAGQLSSTIAGGALAAMNVGASLNSGSTTSASGAENIGWTYGTTKTCNSGVTVNYEAEEDPGTSCPF